MLVTQLRLCEVLAQALNAFLNINRLHVVMVPAALAVISGQPAEQWSLFGNVPYQKTHAQILTYC
eukprot:1238956-Amphidinium_carterae.2